MYPRPQDYVPPSGDEFVPKGAHLLNTVFVGIFATAAAGVVAWLFALGGVDTIKDSIDRAEFASSPPWLTLGSPHQGVADAAVLTLGDLPPGWTLATDDGGDSDFDYTLSEDCKQLEDQANSATVDAYAKSKTMRGPERQIVRSNASVFGGSEAAQGSLDANRQLFAQCGGELVDALQAELRKRMVKDGLSPDAVQVQIAFQELGPPNVAEAAMMFRLAGTVTGPARSSEFAVDFIALRHGRMLGAVIYTSFGGVRAEEEQQLAQIAAAKLQTANASFPEA